MLRGILDATRGILLFSDIFSLRPQGNTLRCASFILQMGDSLREERTCLRKLREVSNGRRGQREGQILANSDNI